MLMKPSAGLQQLMQQIGDVVPQPAHSSQSVARSVERAVGASHGTAGWACKAATQEADLPRLQRARRASIARFVGAVQGRSRNLCLKGLKENGVLGPAKSNFFPAARPTMVGAQRAMTSVFHTNSCFWCTYWERDCMSRKSARVTKKWRRGMSTSMSRKKRSRVTKKGGVKVATWHVTKKALACYEKCPWSDVSDPR